MRNTKRLHFYYEMEIAYSEEVAKCYFTIKCFPQNTIRQTVENVKIAITPSVPYGEGHDSLGNRQIYGVDDIPHDCFLFSIEGDGVVGLESYEELAEEANTMIFRHPHGLNQAGDCIQAYFASNKPDVSLPVYEQALYLMHALHRDFQYLPCTTTVETSAEEAFKQGHGVCQDYAHIFIALMHLAGIPARYVTGLIVGEGASHAWVEIMDQGKWYGLDPTNDTPVEADHIKIGVGRDAKDCMINRGIVHGGGLHTQTIRVNVSEI